MSIIGDFLSRVQGVAKTGAATALDAWANMSRSGGAYAMTEQTFLGN